MNATKKANIPKETSATKGINLKVDFLTFKGNIIAAPNHPADKFTNKSDRILVNIGSIQ